jgi:hypothetical protein
MNTIKQTYNYAYNIFWIAVWVLKYTATKILPLALGVALALGFTYNLFLQPDHPNPATLTYDQWVEHRAEWLKDRDDFTRYIDNEAHQTVNMKATSEAQQMQKVYRLGVDSEPPATTNDVQANAVSE